jgi:tetratricopeptide (TPR) repeat protein
LPTLCVYVAEDASPSRARTAARRLVGSADLFAQHEVAIWFETGDVATTTIETSVRIFSSKSDEEDGGVEALVRSLGLSGDEAQRRGSRYQDLRSQALSIQEQVAAKLNEVMESQRFEALAEDLEPFDTAIADDPTDPKPHYERARFLMQNAFYGQALASIDEAVARGLDTQAVHEDRLRVLRGLDEVAGATAAAERLLTADPSNVVALGVLAWAKLQNDEHAAALALYDRAIAVDGTDPESHLGRGQALAGLTRDDDALAAFRRALELDPTLGEAHIRSALSLIERERDSEVLDEIEKALKCGWSNFDSVRKFEDALEPAARRQLRALVDKYEASEGNPATTGPEKVS